MGGVEVYFGSLLDQLQRLDRNNEYQVLCNRKNQDKIRITNRRFSKRQYDLTRPSLRWFIHRGVRKAIGFDFMRPAIDRLRCDVIHHPFTVLNPMGLETRRSLVHIQHEYFLSFSEISVGRYRRSVARRRHHRFRNTERTLVEKYADPTKIESFTTGRPGVPSRGTRRSADFRRRDRPFRITWRRGPGHRRLRTGSRSTDTGSTGLILTGTREHHEEVLRQSTRLARSREDPETEKEDLPPLYSLARLMDFHPVRGSESPGKAWLILVRTHRFRKRQDAALMFPRIPRRILRKRSGVPGTTMACGVT
jgi:hypothetical protein